MNQFKRFIKIAGFFPPFSQMIDYLLFGARQGLYLPLIVVLSSLPFSLLAYGAACLLLVIFVKRFGTEQLERAQLRSVQRPVHWSLIIVDCALVIAYASLD
jgi:hypothetical protein